MAGDRAGAGRARASPARQRRSSAASRSARSSANAAAARSTCSSRLFDRSRPRRASPIFAAREAAGPFATDRPADAGRRRATRRRRSTICRRAAPSYRHGVLREGFGDERRPLILFGAGHVGRALVLALAPLPFAVTWVDPRPDAFPAYVPANVDAPPPRRSRRGACRGAGGQLRPGHDPQPPARPRAGPRARSPTSASPMSA